MAKMKKKKTVDFKPEEKSLGVVVKKAVRKLANDMSKHPKFDKFNK
jgi:hypothetical protein